MSWQSIEKNTYSEKRKGGGFIYIQAVLCWPLIIMLSLPVQYAILLDAVGGWKRFD